MFTQKISMDCTQEQYEKYLKAELEKMGYGASLARWGNDVIVNNYSSENGLVGNPSRISNKFDNSRTYLGKFNAPLFLALAAMTDKTGTLGYREYVTKEFDGSFGANMWGMQDFCHKGYHKATVSEIMAKFGEQPHKDTDRLIEELQQQAKEMLDALDELKKEREEPKHEEPIIGELAIGYDNNRTIIGILNVKDKSGTPYKVGGFWCENAVLFENMEQFKAFINA